MVSQEHSIEHSTQSGNPNMICGIYESEENKSISLLTIVMQWYVHSPVCMQKAGKGHIGPSYQGHMVKM